MITIYYTFLETSANISEYFRVMTKTKEGSIFIFLPQGSVLNEIVTIVTQAEGNHFRFYVYISIP